MEIKEKYKRSSLLDPYSEVILNWLMKYPDMTSAQVLDWLKESYSDKAGIFIERSVSRYVRQLRMDYDIPRSKVMQREYESVLELPMGYQIQVDFGQKYMLKDNNTRQKVYFVVFVLSHSRYKWGYFQTKPFTTQDLIFLCDECFRTLGGMPIELVFDQDSIVVVSENNGDIIYTYEFEKYRKERKFKMFVCRRADPETKGIVESGVKFVKRNFLPNRTYHDDFSLNQSFLAWLERTGNGKVHSITKKVPFEVFAMEREHLQIVPLLNGAFISPPILTRKVRKDNTIFFEGNRYSVPFGTYSKHDEVAIEAKEGKLIITNAFGDYVIAEHEISPLKGQLIKNTHHKRTDTDSTIRNLFDEIDKELDHAYTDFLEQIKEEKPRYIRDQLLLIKDILGTYSKAIVINAFEYCKNNRLFSTTDIKNAAQFFKTKNEPVVKAALFFKNKANIPAIKAQKRNISEYTAVIEQDSERRSR